VPSSSQVFARVHVSLFKMKIRFPFHWRASARRGAEPVVNRKRPKSGDVPPAATDLPPRRRLEPALAPVTQGTASASLSP
jgi:hypothetical protein